jgi:hypothetical protein
MTPVRQMERNSVFPEYKKCASDPYWITRSGTRQHPLAIFQKILGESAKVFHLGELIDLTGFI